VAPGVDGAVRLCRDDSTARRRAACL
jgi:hypothetical protein